MAASMELCTLKHALLLQFAAFPVNGVDLYDHMLSYLAILATGCPGLDRLLDGGIFTGEITEVCGSTATGKTQLCMSIAANVAARNGQNTFYISTNAGFFSDRLLQIIASKFTSDEGSVDESLVTAALARVRCQHAFELSDLMKTLHEVSNQLTSQVDSFFGSLKVIVVDSVTAVLSYLLSAQHAEGHRSMMELARLLKSLCAENGVAVVVVNTTLQSKLVHVKPSLGYSWAHVPNTRLLLTLSRCPDIMQGGPVYRHASLLKSTRQATGQSVDYTISAAGIQDVT
ncbi:PREDICTED: DNA repair protein RAD51 homolog 4-like isoform X2 [Priapulus caudatus]|uniref:DNA repair protein RAD51 homolog 4-like isoform X2 n=1 Tax=Priapulus caudatus TaxID=37621 RepID=A0ABM1ECK4_PRICU|nr:PREDICTED: DNA repair protein RAD51 homolog 4-like isoform X2 [Priapulus caudatus]